jgi:hypothetical protein
VKVQVERLIFDVKINGLALSGETKIQGALSETDV